MTLLNLPSFFSPTSKLGKLSSALAVRRSCFLSITILEVVERFLFACDHFSLTSRFLYKEAGFSITLQLQPAYGRVGKGGHDRGRLDMFPCPECVGPPRCLPSLPRLSLDGNRLVHSPMAAVLSLSHLLLPRGPAVASLTIPAGNNCPILEQPIYLLIAVVVNNSFNTPYTLGSGLNTLRFL